SKIVQLKKPIGQVQNPTLIKSIEQDNKGQVHNNAYCAIFGRNTFRLNISIFKIIIQTFSPANTASPSNQDAS
ncbi:21504_t:CDS:1, partial [Rhizophagus irregularis]